MEEARRERVREQVQRTVLAMPQDLRACFAEAIAASPEEPEAESEPEATLVEANAS